MATTNELDTLRTRIDPIDHQIHQLLIQRFKLVSHISAVKNANTRQITAAYLPEREKQIMVKHEPLSSNDSQKRYLQNIYRAIFAASRRIQQKFNIGVYQPSDDDTYAAALYHFGDDHHFEVMTVLEALMTKMKEAHYDYLVINAHINDAEKKCLAQEGVTHYTDITLYTSQSYYLVYTLT